MKLGANSAGALLVIPLILVGTFLYLIKSNPTEAIIGLAIIFFLNLFIGFFLFKIFVITDKLIVVKSLLNPFQDDIAIEMNKLNSVKIVRNTVQGWSTTIKFYMTNKMCISVRTSILRFEEEKFSRVLTENGIDVSLVKA